MPRARAVARLTNTFALRVPSSPMQVMQKPRFANLIDDTTALHPFTFALSWTAHLGQNSRGTKQTLPRSLASVAHSSGSVGTSSWKRPPFCFSEARFSWRAALAFLPKAATDSFGGASGFGGAVDGRAWPVPFLLGWAASPDDDASPGIERRAAVGRVVVASVARGVGCVCCLSWWGWGESTHSLPPRSPPTNGPSHCRSKEDPAFVHMGRGVRGRRAGTDLHQQNRARDPLHRQTIHLNHHHLCDHLWTG
jgi:hypothetical protein